MSAQSSKYHGGNVSPASTFHVPDYTTKKCENKLKKSSNKSITCVLHLIYAFYLKNTKIKYFKLRLKNVPSILHQIGTASFGCLYLTSGI